jgi:UPF0176 protein
MSELINLESTEKLKKKLENENEKRMTVSFYKYHSIPAPKQFRDELFENLSNLNVFGRIFVAGEGINAQVSIPLKNFNAFREFIETYDFLKNIRLNIALEDDGKSFWKLIVRVRSKIVADGIEDENFSVENKGQYLNAREFNELTKNPETILVDMRNFYEYEVGHFENAREIPADTFREQLPLAVKILEEKKENPIVMYCTGGIRCEKASAYLKFKGFKDVFHLEGGIIEYVREVKEKNLENKFKGKNFVFDARMGERITDDILSRCHQCGESCDAHHNCENLGCHLLFIQCEKCFREFEGCCSEECQKIIKMPEEKQKEIRRQTKEKPEVFCNSQKRRELKLKK